MPLFSAACLMTCLQWSGLNGVYFNLNTLFRTAGVPDDITPYLSVAMSVVQFACTLLGVMIFFFIVQGATNSYSLVVFLWCAYKLIHFQALEVN